MFARRWRRRENDPDENDLPSAADTPSAVESLAHTVVSTIAEGLVHTVAHWKVLLLGQAISIILAVAGGTNEVLAEECNVSTPAAYNMAGYALVAILGAIMLRKDMKRDNKAATSEEQESFHTADENRDTSFLTANQGHDVTDGDGNEHEDDEVDDDLTLEDDNGPTLRSMFSRSNGSPNGNGPNHRSSSNKSHGSASKKLRVQYPFLCGMFTIHAKWYYYFAVAFIEAQAYYLLFLAFRYTSFTFVYISDALAIPSAMLFTKLIMKRSYLWVHLIGAAVCIVGIVVNTASDIKPNEDTIEEELDEHISSADHLKGDIYALVGAILLGLDDVLSEILVSDYGGVTEMLFMKGLYGALISVVQMLIFETDSITALFSSEGSCGLSWRVVLFTVHVVFRALDVWGEMQFLFVSEAALLNLSLLTSDLYAAIFDVLAIGIVLTPYFYAAFCLVFFGIVLYEAGPSPAEQHPTNTPLSIEFRDRGKKRHEVDVTSSTATEHVGNLGENVDVDGELT